MNTEKRVKRVRVGIVPRPSRVLRRELEQYIGRKLSGRQWTKWRKTQQRAGRLEALAYNAGRV